ncbi:MAG: FprA family A-type flavoprotein [Clostridia bacterium]|nr:FprA family A-type flavoprotein [Clostridia bacterium]
MEIAKGIYNIGVTDKDIDLFEGLYIVPDGVLYNSYVVIDDKITVFDTADARFSDEWLANLKSVLDGRQPDYLVVEHMEPDHSASIAKFVSEYPDAVVVSETKAFKMMTQFFGNDIKFEKLEIKEGDELCTGRHNFKFVAAPMVHWPEVMIAYDTTDKILFSADAFGKFGSSDSVEDWDDEARRYYIGIVGKYGAQVQTLLKKAATLDISMICPLHGPVLKENLGHYISLYDKWSSYTPEDDGVVIAYASIYGNTKKAALLLAENLKENGCENVKVFDLARADKYEALAQAFRLSKLVLASPTYNSELFPPVRAFMDMLAERGYKNRTVAMIENGSWAPVAARLMEKRFAEFKGITFAENKVSVKSALSEGSVAQIEALADELCR